MRRGLLTGAALLALCFVGCDSKNKAKPQTGPKGPKQPQATQLDRSKCDTKGKRVVQLDLNRDKQPDVWNIYTKRTEGGASVDVLSCKAIDLNFDGRRDMWKYYGNNGALEREEMDLDFDGRVDIVSFRRSGKIFRQEMDTNYDGKTDIWKHYEDGVLARVERDSNNDGKVDYWEYYEGGSLDRIGYDKNGDGRVDHWDRAASKATAAAPKTATPTPPKEIPKK